LHVRDLSILEAAGNREMGPGITDRFLRLPVTAELEEHESAGTASTDAPATCKADAMLHRDKYVSRSGKFLIKHSKINTYNKINT
jgi:hypothetical protein